MSFEELERIDREWEKERERYMVTSRYGRRYVPSMVAAVGFGVIVAGVGLIWTVMGFGLVQDFGRAAGMFPLLGMVFVVCGAAISLYQFNKAKRYQTAYRAYQRRRSSAQEQLME
jgi:hypothetical protein